MPNTSNRGDAYICERLSKRHNRSAFDSGVPELDKYLRERASQDMRRRVAAAFVLVPKDEPETIAGFYTLSSASIVLDELPDQFAARLPRYPHVPAVLIGRLARDRNFPGVGSLLLVDALQRAVRNADDVASAVVLVDAKNEAAVGFYEKFGFERVSEESARLYLPLKTAETLLES